MAYSGFLIKVGEYKIPEECMKLSSYSAYRNIQDVDDYRDGNGVLHRTALEHIPDKGEFETVDMTSTEFCEIMEGIRANYIVAEERKALVTLFIPETDSYITQDMYMSTPMPTIHSIENGVVRYNPCRIAFIGY